jgi:hypothetical protein
MPPQFSSPTGRGEPGWPVDAGQPDEPASGGSTPGGAGPGGAGPGGATRGGAGPGEPGWPGGPGWPGTDDWPDEDAPDPTWPAPADRPEAAAPPGSGGWRYVLMATAVAVVAAAAGAGIALAASPTPSPSPATAQSSPTPFTAPRQGDGNGGIPGGGLPSGAVEQMILGGKVLAVSSTSITIDGGGHRVTAEVTKSTRFTGRVSAIGSVKVGDMIAVEMTVTGGKLTAVTIQDPATGLPSGGNLSG